MSNTERRGLAFAFIFIGLEGIGMFLMYHVFGVSYASNSIAKVMIYVQLILAAFAMMVNYTYFDNMGFGYVESKNMKWYMPFAIILVSIVVANFMTADWSGRVDYLLLIQTIVMTMFVGIAEEVVFRGFLLNSLLEKGQVKRAIFISAFMFSLLHAVNIFAGLTVLEVVSQLVMTFIFGLAFACIAVKIKNIIPLIIYHWLWDMCVISSNLLGSKILVFTAMAIILEFLVIIAFTKDYKQLKNI